jgi:hypothetical protein
MYSLEYLTFSVGTKKGGHNMRNSSKSTVELERRLRLLCSELRDRGSGKRADILSELELLLSQTVAVYSSSVLDMTTRISYKGEYIEHSSAFTGNRLKPLNYYAELTFNMLIGYNNGK